MLRKLRWPAVALFLIVVGAWPAAITPVALAAAGAGAVIAAIPAPALLAAGFIAWLKHQPARPATA